LKGGFLLKTINYIAMWVVGFIREIKVIEKNIQIQAYVFFNSEL